MKSIHAAPERAARTLKPTHLMATSSAVPLLSRNHVTEHSDARMLEACLAEIAAAGADASTPTLARAGVLQLRLGSRPDAIETLILAADRSAEAGHRNNALALCHRALRAGPSEPLVLRRIAAWSAELGYRKQAASALHDYVSTMEMAGDIATAAEGLRAYLRLFPDDAQASSRLASLLGEEEAAPERPLPAAETEEPAATEPVAIAPLEGLQSTHLDEPWAEDAPSEPETLPLLGFENDEPDGVTEPVAQENPPPPAEDESSLGESTHCYDLAVAYKEMGLWDESIRQLKLAVDAGARLLPVLELLGECYVEKGHPQRAVQILEHAARLPRDDANDLTGVNYWLRRAREAAGAEAARSADPGPVAALWRAG